jgi:class 3 adenylate cyclase
MNSAVQPHAFVSYVREDRLAVENLCAELKRHDIAVWLDREKIHPGERWQIAIRRAIEEGAFFIACFSTSYNVRGNSYMNVELTIAIDQLRSRPTDRAWFIPILLEGGIVPDRPIGGGETLRDIQWVDLGEDWDDGVRRIVSVLRPDAPQIVRAPPSQDRTVTLVILVADLVGFTALAERSGPEELLVIINHVRDVVSHAVAEQRGESIQLMGDGLLAAFQLAPDAIRCAQQIQHKLSKSDRLGKLSMRIGIAAGHIIRHDGALLGGTLNIAARICSLADSGQILIAESVRALGVGQGVQLTEQGPMALKGIPEPLHVYEVRD